MGDQQRIKLKLSEVHQQQIGTAESVDQEHRGKQNQEAEGRGDRPFRLQNGEVRIRRAERNGQIQRIAVPPELRRKQARSARAGRELRAAEGPARAPREGPRRGDLR